MYNSVHLQCCAAITTGSCPAACGILVPWPEIKPAFPALEGRISSTGPPWKPPKQYFFKSYFKNSRWEYKEHIFHVAGCFFLPMMGLTVSGLLYWLSWYRICLRCRRPGFDSWVRKIRRRRDRLPTSAFLGFPFGSADKESACSAGDLGAVPGLGRSPGEGKGYPL